MAVKYTDFIGTKFNHLTPVREMPRKIYPNGRSIPMYECLCDCGNTVIVRKDSITSGHTKSCGCQKKKIFAKHNKKQHQKAEKNLLGKTFGRLTVLSYHPDDKKYLCQCQCGKTIKVASANLYNNSTISCGCSRNHDMTDIIGKTFGKLTVTALHHTVRHKNKERSPTHFYTCLCQCGKEKIVARNSLLSGKTTHCGCSRKIADTVLENIGKTINGITILGLEKEKPNSTNHVYKCRCVCGNIFYSQDITRLKRNRASCGCLQKSKARIGETATQTYSGMSAFITEIRSPSDITIRFEDGQIKTGVSYSKFKQGLISHPILSRPFKNQNKCINGITIRGQAFRTYTDSFWYVSLPNLQTEDILTTRQILNTNQTMT